MVDAGGKQRHSEDLDYLCDSQRHPSATVHAEELAEVLSVGRDQTAVLLRSQMTLFGLHCGPVRK